jgi:outer membrane protein OmpA-like peptidoglycan-associated protein
VVIVLIVVGLLIAVGICGAIYLGYKAKKKIDEVKEAVNSGNVDDVANAIGGGPSKAVDAMPTYPEWGGGSTAPTLPAEAGAPIDTAAGGGKPEASIGDVLPMRKGLRITTAIQQSAGDYESIKEIRSVNGEGVLMDYSADNLPEQELPFMNEQEKAAAKKVKRSVHTSRMILSADLQDSHEYAESFGEMHPLSLPNTTALGLSATTLNDLVTKGESEFSYHDPGLKGALGGLLGGLAGMAQEMNKNNPNGGTAEDQKAQQAMKDLQNMGKVNCMLKRADQKVHSFPVLLNDERVQLPAIRANCKSDDGKLAEFYFLNDPQNPLSLTWKIGKSDRLQVVKLEYAPVPHAAGGGAASSGAKQLEQKLEQQEKVRIYGIYFDFKSSEIKQQSKPTLDEIAEVMAAHPDWKLHVAGHTDNIGGDAFNLQLSQQRAEAVKAVLVTQYKISPERLTTAGFGASSPVETNETMEGRARNRRVELSKQ